MKPKEEKKFEENKYFDDEALKLFEKEKYSKKQKKEKKYNKKSNNFPFDIPNELYE